MLTNPTRSLVAARIAVGLLAAAATLAAGCDDGDNPSPISCPIDGCWTGPLDGRATLGPMPLCRDELQAKGVSTVHWTVSDNGGALQLGAQRDPLAATSQLGCSDDFEVSRPGNPGWDYRLHRGVDDTLEVNVLHTGIYSSAGQQGQCTMEWTGTLTRCSDASVGADGS